MMLQVRVLAARDPHGSIQLAQARASDGSLVIATGRFLPEGCHDLTEILPGYFKCVSSPRRPPAHLLHALRQRTGTLLLSCEQAW